MPHRDAIPAGFCGHVDAIEPTLAGWVVDLACPSVPVTSFLSIDRSHPLPVVANIPRPDVAAAGLGGPNCGFSVDLPAQFLDGAEHELALRLPDGRRLNLPGSPASVALGPVHADLIPASAASIDAVAELLRRNDFETGFDPELVGVEHAKAFNVIAEPSRGFICYARIANRLVGYGRLDRGQGDARALGVVALTVLEAYRRKGIGEALMRALQRAATAGDLCEVWL
jgi:ribosomal protein S18 acetylase RimI-like enzyme